MLKCSLKTKMLRKINVQTIEHIFFMLCVYKTVGVQIIRLRIYLVYQNSLNVHNYVLNVYCV